MEFEFTGTIWVEESDLRAMKNRVKRGCDPNEVFEKWVTGLDDTDYYTITEYCREKILEEITNFDK